MFSGFRNKQKVTSYVGYGATCLLLVAILVWRAVEFNGNYKDKSIVVLDEVICHENKAKRFC